MSVVIDASNHGGTPSIADSYNLTCYTDGGSVSGITYQWWKNNTQLLNYDNRTTIQFQELELSNAGEYSCSVLFGNRIYNTSHILLIKSKFVTE